MSTQAPLDAPEPHPRAGFPFPTDNLADLLQLLSHPLVGGNDIVEGIGDLARQLGPVSRQPNGKVAGAHGLKRIEELG